MAELEFRPVSVFTVSLTSHHGSYHIIYIYVLAMPSRLSALQRQEPWLFYLFIPSTYHSAWLRTNA